MQELDLRPRHEEMFLSLLRRKNRHGISKLFDSIGAGEEMRETAIALSSAYGSPESVLKTLRSLSLNRTMDEAADELEVICSILENQDMENIHLDFSLVKRHELLQRRHVPGIHRRHYRRECFPAGSTTSSLKKWTKEPRKIPAPSASRSIWI